MFSIWVDGGQRVEATTRTYVFNRAEISLSTPGRPKRTFADPNQAPGSSAIKGSGPPVWVFTLPCLPLVGVYFGYFLDPNQGQTGPVSWEVAPLPPPRPVLTFTYINVRRRRRYRPAATSVRILKLLFSNRVWAGVSCDKTAERNNAAGRETNSAPAHNARSG
jgi:hypothetical protein